MPKVELRLLGQFRLSVDDHDVSLTAKKSQALLCFLACHADQPVSREKLASLMWTDTAEKFARTNLRQCVAVVRKSMKNDQTGCVTNSDGALILNSTQLSSDVAFFNDCCATNTSESLENALALYRGELLEGIHLNEVSFTEWLESERRKYHESFSVLCHQLLGLYRVAGNVDAEMSVATRLLAHDDVDESAHRSLMYSHQKLDRRNLAIRQYESCVQILKAKVDTEPEVATRELYHSILKHSKDKEKTFATQGFPRMADNSNVTSNDWFPLKRQWARPLLVLLVVTTSMAMLLNRQLGAPEIAGANPVNEKTLTYEELSSALNLATAAIKTSQPIIAVLPFFNMSKSAEQDYFSDGLSEDLITDLSKIAGLTVIARASSFNYRDSIPDIPRIAHDLNASVVLYGSIRKSANRVRINAQLINVADGTQLWADRYDRKLEDVLVLQDEISQAIVEQLSVTLSASEQQRLERVLKVDADAYDLFLRSLRPIRELTKTGSAEARRILHQVAEIDSNYARAWANLALTHAQDTNMGFSDNREESIRLGLEYAGIAAELDDSLPQLHFTQSQLHLATRSFDRAVASALKSIELDPNYADGYGALAQALLFSGELDSATAALNKAKQLNPGFTFTYLWMDGQINFLSEKLDQAINIFTEINTRNPSFVSSRLLLIASYGHLKRLDDAEWEIAELLTLRPDFSVEQERQNAMYQSEHDIRFYIDGLIKAGL